MIFSFSNLTSDSLIAHWLELLATAYHRWSGKVFLSGKSFRQCSQPLQKYFCNSLIFIIIDYLSHISWHESQIVPFKYVLIIFLIMYLCFFNCVFYSSNSNCGIYTFSFFQIFFPPYMPYQSIRLLNRTNFQKYSIKKLDFI